MKQQIPLKEITGGNTADGRPIISFNIPVETSKENIEKMFRVIDKASDKIFGKDVAKWNYNTSKDLSWYYGEVSSSELIAIFYTYKTKKYTIKCIDLSEEHVSIIRDAIDSIEF